MTSPLATAIIQAEGTTYTGANNPGSLVLGDKYGLGTSGSAGITNFPDFSSGLAALEKQVSLMTNGGSSIYSPDMSIGQANAIYTNNGQSSTWADILGISNDTPLSQVNSTNASSTISGSILDRAKQLGKKALSGVTGVPEGVFSLSVQDFVIIAVGLLLVAAGIFSFKPAQAAAINVIKKSAVAA